MKKKITLDILIFLFIVLFVYLVSFKNNITVKSGNFIAVVYLEGTIGEVGQNSFNSSDVKKIFGELRKNKPKGIILRISSPGGTVYETDQIYNLIKQFKINNNIKIYVSMGEVCASGGYYIAMSSDKIFAEPLTETGSIGVIMNLLNYEELLKKVGINIITIKSGKFKDIGSPYRELTYDEKKMFEEIVNEMYEKFLNVVKENRVNLDEVNLRNLAQGQIYLGSKAYKLGLVDKIGTLDDTISELKKDLNLETIDVKEYRIQKSFLQSLFGETLDFLQHMKDPSQIIFEYKIN
ncbi:signal peptide peptidase SppA [Caldisericum sp.]|uniref:signal peptide peptidase SppA n=1 Tax=Caldisericum sp. TaxID=2499687 RepID=UPI003D14480A